MTSPAFEHGEDGARSLFLTLLSFIAKSKLFTIRGLIIVKGYCGFEYIPDLTKSLLSRPSTTLQLRCACLLAGLSLCSEESAQGSSAAENRGAVETSTPITSIGLFSSCYAVYEIEIFPKQVLYIPCPSLYFLHICVSNLAKLILLSNESLLSRRPPRLHTYSIYCLLKIDRPFF